VSVPQVKPYAGFAYRPDTVTLSHAHQHDKLSACGLDPAVFEDCADPSFFIGMAIHAGIASGISAEGNVNMLTSLVQHRPVRLDEPLTVWGRITAVTAVPRGLTVDTEVRFEDAAGLPAMTTRRRSLKPDPDKAGTRGAGERPAPVVADARALQAVAAHTLRPDQVKAYSSEGNSIHYEPAAAMRAGFRAPIIGGGMGVHFLMAALWQRFQPRQLDVDVYFRRPIFWDDSIAVAVDAPPGGAPWRALCLYKGGKVATEARLNRLS
jgi:hypothetical protein